uniref:Uncharacterized protein n=1 Tax=Arundo donax TaxID=35708 RepID=A0A0A8YQ27_ARUDO
MFLSQKVYRTVGDSAKSR